MLLQQVSGRIAMPLRFITAGESHGPCLTVILEGVPAGLAITEESLARDLSRRQTGSGTGPRLAQGMENDIPRILAGVMNGRTTGAPVALQIVNRDHVNWKGRAVPAFTIPRPGHADLPAAVKYGYDDFRYSLERASARETAARVAAGSVCRALLDTFDIRVGGYVTAIGGTAARLDDLSFEERIAGGRAAATSCPDPRASEAMMAAIDQARQAGDTLGGVIEVVALQCPPGLGSFATWEERLDSRLAAAVLGVPAMKGFEIGDAFATAARTGTTAQDAVRCEAGRIIRGSNRSGGIEGGISNGQPILVRAAMKPIPTTIAPQESVNLAAGGAAASTVYERSDTCPVPRAVVVLEAVVCFVIARALLEKLGGDSLDEIRPRFEALRSLAVDRLRLSPEPKVFWP
jgi:chorismate synthase